MQASKIWKKLFSSKYLNMHYEEKIKLKPTIGMDKITPQKFEMNLHENIEIILRKTKNDTYHFTKYKQLLLLKGSNKLPRVICIPTMRDKLVLSILNELLCGVFGNDCKTEMPQVIINSILNKRSSYDSFIKIDIKGFYGSISHDKLIKKLKNKIRKKEVIHLIEKSIKTDSLTYSNKEKKNYFEKIKGIPEGLPISNALANIYLIKLDKKYRSKKNLQYYRYVDDILILLNKEDLKEIKLEIKYDIENLGLKINDEKYDENVLNKGFEYLGYKIEIDRITVRQSGVFKIEQSIEKLLRELKGNKLKYIEWKLNLKITGCILDKHKYGWLFFYSQITDLQLLYHLDDLIKKLMIRYGFKEEIRIKRFVRAHAEICKSLFTTKYIPNLDNFSIEKKKLILSEIYDENLDNKDNSYIEILFKKIMKKEIIDLEKDIQNIS